MNRVRTFLAIPIDGRPLERIEKQIHELRSQFGGYRWVIRENIHLTLVFLGEISATQIPLMHELLTENLADLSPFDLHLSQLGAFPRPNQPRILWVGCAEGREKVITLQSRVSDALEVMGYRKEERPYVPHVTIGRLIRGKPVCSSMLEDYKEFDPGKIRVECVQIMQSELLPKGPKYTTLATLNLETVDNPEMSRR